MNKSIVYTAFTGRAQAYVRAYNFANAVNNLRKLAAENRYEITAADVVVAKNQHTYSGMAAIDEPAMY